MKKSKSFLLLVFFVLIVFIITLEYYGAKRHRYMYPSSENVELDDFINSNKQICCIQNIVVNGKTYTLVIGHTPVASLLRLPSGPPAYIFDERNVLVDWCKDTGDNHVFVEKWAGLGHGNFTHTHTNRSRGQTQK